MDVATAMSSATLVEHCCSACLAHRLVMWQAHFRCSLQATRKESVQAPSYFSVSFPSKVLVLKSFSSMLPCTCPKSVWSKNSCHDPVHDEAALIKKLGTEGRSQHAISVFNACSQMSTCHYNVVLVVCAGCGELQLMDRVLDLSLKTEVAHIKTIQHSLEGTRSLYQRQEHLERC